MLQIENCKPPKSSTTSKMSLYLELVDTDESDTHQGRITQDTLDWLVNTHGHYYYVVDDGAVQKRTARLAYNPEAMTGSKITGSLITGRWRKRVKLYYPYEEAVADGTTVWIHITASNDYGQTIDEYYWVKIAEWQSVKLPVLTLEDGSDTVVTVQIPYYVLGTSTDKTVTVYWGKDSPLTYQIDNLYVSLQGGDANALGKEFLDNKYISINDTPVGSNDQVNLGKFNVGDSGSIKFTIAAPSDAATTYPVAIPIAFEKRSACLTGKGWTGLEMTGSSPNIGDWMGLEDPWTLFINVISATLKSYLEDHGITWQT